VVGASYERYFFPGTDVTQHGALPLQSWAIELGYRYTYQRVFLRALAGAGPYTHRWYDLPHALTSDGSQVVLDLAVLYRLSAELYVGGGMRVAGILVPSTSLETPDDVYSLWSAYATFGADFKIW
jgi:hypothetical protein